ncbi:MAG: DNA primase [Chitinophagaceae bacterium]|nr:MAG: DNA primase [Chitinophagaceae bacterium]
MNINEAKELDLVEYLSRIGHKPEKISGQHYWYLSPLRDEKTPSFKVNRKLNKWYDWGAEGTERHGNLIDFGILYHHCSVRDFLKMLDDGLTVSSIRKNNPQSSEEQERKIEILSIQSIHSFSLFHYLKQRHIHMQVANDFLKEVRYKNGDKSFYGLGFKNDSGGYEIRSSSFKGSSSPKDVTSFDNDARELAVFEGAFDFLSYKTIYRILDEPKSNYLILNSDVFFEKSLPTMLEYPVVRLYLDNDKTGQKFTLMAQKTDALKFHDMRRLYQSYKDLNEWHVNFGNGGKHKLRLEP